MVYFFQYWHLPQDGVLKMLRIFVTGDNHIGLKYASHEQAAILASSRMAAFEGMVKTANQENCALFAITGDLFENTYSVSKKEIKYHICYAN